MATSAVNDENNNINIIMSMSDNHTNTTACACAGNNVNVSVPVTVNQTRIRDEDGFVGTVRYVGPVASAKDATEQYAGVEWDDSTRGKHDGSVICRRTNQLVRHFKCHCNINSNSNSNHSNSNSNHSNSNYILHNSNISNSNNYSSSNTGSSTPSLPSPAPTTTVMVNHMAASFIRLKKLDTGVALNGPLLQSKYVKVDDPNLVADATTKIIPDCYAMTSKGYSKPIEFHGEIQIRQRQQLSDLQRLAIRCAGISSIDTSDLMGIVSGAADVEEDSHSHNAASSTSTSTCSSTINSNDNNHSANENAAQQEDSAAQKNNSAAQQDTNHSNSNSNKNNNNSNKNNNNSNNIIHAIGSTITNNNSNSNYDHIKELDLAGNLLCDWNEVVKLLQCFPNVERLSLASNKLLNLTTTKYCNENEKSPSLPHTSLQVQVLNLNDCGITSFQTIVELSKWMPHLQELCLAKNDLSDMQQHVVSSMNNNINHTSDVTSDVMSVLFPQLTMLDVSGCKLSSWSKQVMLFDTLMPNLQELILNDNLIQQIGSGFEDEGEDEEGGEVQGQDQDSSTMKEHINKNENHNVNQLLTVNMVDMHMKDKLDLSETHKATTAANSIIKSSTSCFQSLVSLHLSHCGIQDWASLNWLSMKLKSVRFRNNPVTADMGASEARSMVIARLPTLEYLNASVVSVKERMDSERRYVQNVLRYLNVETQTRLVHNVSHPSPEHHRYHHPETSHDKKQQMQQEFQHTLLQQGHHLPLMHTLLLKHYALSTGAANKHTQMQQPQVNDAPKEESEETGADILNRLLQPDGNGRHGNGTSNNNNGNGSFGSGMGSETVTISVKSMAASSCTQEALRKRLPGTIKVGRLKAMCSRYFGLHPEHIALHFKADPSDAFPTELDDEEHTLQYFGVQDGTEILLNDRQD
jgi:hypothetical protein